MEDANFYVIRTLFNLLKSCYYDDALKEAGIQSLQYRSIFLSLVFLFRCLRPCLHGVGDPGLVG